MAPARNVSKPGRWRTTRVRASLKSLTDDHRNLSSRDEDQRQIRPATQPSTSGLNSERKTPDQQKAYGKTNPLLGTTTPAQNGVAGTLGHGTRKLMTDKLSTHKSNREYHDLLGVGSQYSSQGNVQDKPRPARMEKTLACPYHRRLLEEPLSKGPSDQGSGPMHRYLAEGTSERYAILPRPDTASVSTDQGCRCFEIMQARSITGKHVED